MNNHRPSRFIRYLLCAVAMLHAISVFADTAFEKDMQVRLTRDVPVYFQDRVVRQGKAGEVFRVLQYNAAKKRVFVLATDADGKPIAYNLEDDALAVVPGDAKGAPPAAAVAKSNAKSLAALEKFYGINNRKQEAYAVAAPRLEKGGFYIVGDRVQQFTEGVVLAASDGSLSDGDIALVMPGRKGLSGVLTFRNPGAMEGVQLSHGEFIVAVGKLVEFRDVTMVDGSSEKLPVFECVGLTTTRTFFNTE